VQFLPNLDNGFISIGCVGVPVAHLFYSALMEIKDRIAIVRLAMLRAERLTGSRRAILSFLRRERPLCARRRMSFTLLNYGAERELLYADTVPH
jgi:hypothetical protein